MCCCGVSHCGGKAVEFKVEGKIMDIRGWGVSSLHSLNEIWGACQRRAWDLKEYVDDRRLVIKGSIRPPWMPGLSALNDWYTASSVMTGTEAFEGWFCTWKYMCGSCCDYSQSTQKGTRSQKRSGVFVSECAQKNTCTKDFKQYLHHSSVCNGKSDSVFCVLGCFWRFYWTHKNGLCE